MIGDDTLLRNAFHALRTINHVIVKYVRPWIGGGKGISSLLRREDVDATAAIVIVKAQHTIDRHPRILSIILATSNRMSIRVINEL